MAWYGMNAPKNKIIDISPSSRILTSEIQKSVFDKSYLVFTLVMLSAMMLIGYTVSQMHETQKDLKALTEQYELNNLIRLKQVAKSEANKQEIDK